jgi:16S rRNA (cytosine967-C5)-methyltransferase
MLKAGGRIVYVTCSVLADENGAQVRAFRARHPGFTAAPAAEIMAPLGERAFLFGKAVRASPEGLLMTPRTTDTDGFFVSVLRGGGAS